ncbi:signal transduction histidine kinase [Elusimicrobium simillimum]|uniref:sensor histidine kinase n=1 Tax=Elusimicrobium simillimum TaxID=3143438 RepID=UPI003C6F8787
MLNDKKEDIGARIISLISHKLRTPLSIINGYSDAVLFQKDKEKLSPFTAKAIEEINKQGKNLADLIDRLLMFGKADDMKAQDITKTPLNVREIIFDAAKSALTLEDAPAETTLLIKGDHIIFGNIRIEINCPSDITVMGNETLLKSALRELVLNAVKFNKNVEKITKIYCLKHSSNISISVKDNGSGIRPGEVSRIFDRFYQVDEFFTGQVEGWGLGLPFVKRVMDLHEASISVVSDVGLGSVFSLTLPN